MKKTKAFILEFTVFLIIAIVFISILYIAAPKEPEPKDYVAYQVCYGDTLWSICKNEISDIDKHDIRLVIAEIESYNNCSSNLQVGQIIYLPVY